MSCPRYPYPHVDNSVASPSESTPLHIQNGVKFEMISMDDGIAGTWHFLLHCAVCIVLRGVIFSALYTLFYCIMDLQNWEYLWCCCMSVEQSLFTPIIRFYLTPKDMIFSAMYTLLYCIMDCQNLRIVMIVAWLWWYSASFFQL